jgi:23S rRNA (adenine-N6)-dimethyltransferase
MVDIKYSQNFYTNNGNLKRIMDSLNISPNGTVIDIGAGKGTITEILSKYSNDVIAYELDPKYYEILKEKYKDIPNVTVKNEDFLSSPLPSNQYKVFSNIPFSLTSDIVNKITDASSNLVEAYLFVQKESAQRYIGKPINTQISSILSFKYDLNIVERFNSYDFEPIPSIDIVLLSIKKKMVLEKGFELYRDYITYIFNQRNSNVVDTFKKLFTFNQIKYIQGYLKKNGYVKPSDISSKYYLEIFEYFKENGSRYMNIVNGYYKRHLIQHMGREKVNRRR